MRRIITIAALCGLVATAQVSAAEITGNAYFGWLATGATHMIGDNHPFFVGSFSGTLKTDDPASPLSNTAIQCPGYNDIGVDAAGYCITTDADGDKYVTKWSCKAIAPVKGTIAGCEGSATFTGGTGKYAKATGGDQFKAYTVAIHPDGTASGYSLFTDFKLSY